MTIREKKNSQKFKKETFKEVLYESRRYRHL